MVREGFYPSPNELAELRRRSPVPIAGGEMNNGWHEFKALPLLIWYSITRKTHAEMRGKLAAIDKA